MIPTHSIAQRVPQPLVGGTSLDGLPPAPLLRTPGDDPDELQEPFQRDRGSLSDTPRIAELDPESCDLLAIPLSASQFMVQRVCEGLTELLIQGRTVEVLAFGTFRVRPFRPLRPALLGDFSFVEAPYSGPVDFIPSALLIRQLESEQLDAAQVPRCDALYTTLRDDPELPKGKVPQLIKMVFRALADVLMAHNTVLMPSLGFLTLRPRPNELRVDVASGSLHVRSGLKTVQLHALPSMAERIPGLVLPRTVVAPPPEPASPNLPMMADGVDKPSLAARSSAELVAAAALNVPASQDDASVGGILRRPVKETGEIRPATVAQALAEDAARMRSIPLDDENGTDSADTDSDVGDDPDALVPARTVLSTFLAEEDDVLRPPPLEEESEESLAEEKRASAPRPMQDLPLSPDEHSRDHRPTASSLHDDDDDSDLL